MSQPGTLDLDFFDVRNVRLSEPVDLVLRHQALHEEQRATAVEATRTVRIGNLRPEPQGLYVLEVRSRSYQPIRRFVTIPPNGSGRESVVLPIRPDRARAILPDFAQLDPRIQAVLTRSGNVRGHEGKAGQALYDSLTDIEKAGLLNIAKKALTTTFNDGADLLPHLTLLDVFGDRCFVDVPRSLVEQMPHLVDGDLFHPVDGALHHAPQGFMPAGSFKTFDAFGNLQLTFFDNGASCRADVDIDDAAGLGHVFQVIRNEVTGSPTHPFNIHEILIAHQHLDPGYQLLPNG